MDAMIRDKDRHWISFQAVMGKHEGDPIYLAQEAQKQLGYDPRGYGFYGLEVIENEDMLVLKWQCAGSCD